MVEYIMLRFNSMARKMHLMRSFLEMNRSQEDARKVMKKLRQNMSLTSNLYFLELDSTSQLYLLAMSK